MALLLGVTGCSGAGTKRAEGTPPPSATASPSAAATPAAAARSLSAYYAQRLSWAACGDGFQCAGMRVPLDYSDPAGRSIEIRVIRLPASDPSARIGSLVINPGGPGASGIQYARYAPLLFPAEIRARFDVVGFDPRGVGESSPVKCLSDRQLDAFIAVDPSPDNAAEVRQAVDVSRGMADACRRRNGALLAHVSTLDEARDMDILRAALGDRRLTYLGKSYGTYLGAKYAQLFPRNIRALVLDGALDPASSTDELNRVQARGFEQELRAFVDRCVADGGCPLGATVGQASSEVDRLETAADSRPVPGTDGRSVNQAMFFIGVAAGLYSPTRGWTVLESALRALVQGQGEPMLRLADTLTDRDANGHYSNEEEANIAINCVDRPSPRDLGWYERSAAALAKIAPHFGAGIVWSGLPCAYWPVPPVEQPHAVHAEGAPPILVIGTTRDPATPYVWAQNLAHELASGVLLTYDGDGHTAYGLGSTCVDSTVDAYLLRRTVPRNGLVCR